MIGLGSPLMGDDGLGLAALERLRTGWRFAPHVELVDGGTWGMNLLPLIEEAPAVLFLDAIQRSGTPAGEVVVLEREMLPRFFATKLSPHQIDIKEVLALAEFRGTLPERTVAVGLAPSRVEMSTTLSPAVEAGTDAVCAAAIERLRTWGHEVWPSEGGDDA